MYTISETLRPSETVESALAEWLTTDSLRVTVVEVVRFLQESPREDVAYVLRETRRGTLPAVSPAVKQVLVVFLKDYPHRRLEGRVCREGEMPYAFDCPQAILEQLDPTTDPQALEWREQCWQRIRHPLQDGDVIAFQGTIPGLAFLPQGTPVRVSFAEGGPLFEAASSSGTERRRSRVPLWRMFPYAPLNSVPTSAEDSPADGRDG